MLLRISPFIKQLWTVFGVLLEMMGQGMMISYTSCLLPALQSGDDFIQIDPQTASNLASVIGISGLFGVLISSIAMEWLGRRITNTLLTLPGIASWLLIYFSTNVQILTIGRIFGGITAGGTTCVCAVAVGEYTSPENRGMFLNLKTSAVCLGNTIVHILGFYFHWRTVALFALAPQIIALIVACTWQESPAWLASKGYFGKSESVFYWLRGCNEQSKKEFNHMLSAQKARFDSQINQSCKNKIKEFIKKFTRKDFVKPVIIVFIGAILTEACGRHTFPAFAPQIIGEITGNKSQSFYYTVAVDLIITASAMFSSALVKLIKRRTLLFSTGLASLLVLAIVCLYLYLVSIEIISSARTWIPQFLFVIYFILTNLGCTPIPLTFLAELFPLVHRGSGSAVSGIIIGLMFTVASAIFFDLLAKVGVYGTFTVCGAVMAASLTGLYFILPETKDKTLQEIEDYFNTGKFPESSVKKDSE